jgi:putative glutamine amidotransferase
MKITIGLSRGSGSPKYENYTRWLASLGGYEVDTLDLYVEDLSVSLPLLDGLIMTGGGDIEPELYDMAEARNVCDGIEPERDRREGEMLDYCTDHRIPVLGICRGLQYIVVHLDGTLIPHIPDDPDAGSYHTSREGEDNRHQVSIEPGSLLHRGIGELEGEVNSSHHQGVRQVPPELAVSARSADGMIEGIEWQEPEQKNYMVAVQWHPERMDPESRFSQGLLEGFMLEAASASILKRSTPPRQRLEHDSETEESRGKEEGGEGDGSFGLPVIQ